MTLTVICEYLVLQQDCATACYQPCDFGMFWIYSCVHVDFKYPCERGASL